MTKKSLDYYLIENLIQLEKKILIKLVANMMVIETFLKRLDKVFCVRYLTTLNNCTYSIYIYVIKIIMRS